MIRKESSIPLTTIKPVQREPEYEARELTQGGSLATIMLDSQKYLLRITRQGKLILTK